MCRENKAGELDMFYAFESLAKVERARKNEVSFQTAVEQAKSHFEKLNVEDKTWCEASLKKLTE